jgi:hypothetical protein
MALDESRQPANDTEHDDVEEILASETEFVDNDNEDGSSFPDMLDPMQQLTQLLVTEAGTPVVDVLQGLLDAVQKQNKILFKLVSVIESK